jgi:hypothetical protein
MQQVAAMHSIKDAHCCQDQVPNDAMLACVNLGLPPMLQIAAMLADPGLDYDAVSDDSGLYSSSTSHGTANGTAVSSSTDGTASAGEGSTGFGSDQGSDMGASDSGGQLGAYNSNGSGNGSVIMSSSNTDAVQQGGAGISSSNGNNNGVVNVGINGSVNSNGSGTVTGSQAKPRRATRVRSPSAAFASSTAGDVQPVQGHAEGHPTQHSGQQQQQQQQQHPEQHRHHSPTPQGEYGEEMLRTVLYVSGEEMEAQVCVLFSVCTCNGRQYMCSADAVLAAAVQYPAWFIV